MFAWLERFKTPITVALVIGLLAATGLLALHTTVAQQLIARTTSSADDQLLKDLATKQQALLAELATIKLDQPAGLPAGGSAAEKPDVKPSTTVGQPVSASTALTTSMSPTSTSNRLVHLNTADAAALETLPDIGPSKAQAILDYRTVHGRFSSIDELDNVKGIGPTTIEKLRPHLSLD